MIASMVVDDCSLIEGSHANENAMDSDDEVVINSGISRTTYNYFHYRKDWAMHV